MSTYFIGTLSFIGKLNYVSGDMDNWFMPGVKNDIFFSGTIVVAPYGSDQNTKTADLSILVAGQLIKSHSMGGDPLNSFADHVPLGPHSSPTIQHDGYIDNTFFKLELSALGLGELGFSVQGPGPSETPSAGVARGILKSLAASAGLY